MLFYLLLTWLPSFWFDPAMLQEYGFGILRLNEKQIQAKIFSNKTIGIARSALEEANLSKRLSFLF